MAQNDSVFGTTIRTPSIILMDRDNEVVRPLCDPGVGGAAELDFAQQATAGNTLTIGADTYEFRAAAGELSDDDHIGVFIGTNAAATLAKLVLAINGTGTAVADGVLGNGGSALKIANGTVFILAQAAGTSLLIVEADKVGGSIAANGLSAALSETGLHADAIWNLGAGVNINTIGRAGGYRNYSTQTITVTAAMLLSNKEVFLGYPFTPTMFTVSVRTSAGILRGLTADAEVDSDDAFAISGNFIKCVFGATGTVDIVAGDLLVIQAWGA